LYIYNTTVHIYMYTDILSCPGGLFHSVAGHRQREEPVDSTDVFGLPSDSLDQPREAKLKKSHSLPHSLPSDDPVLLAALSHRHHDNHTSNRASIALDQPMDYQQGAHVTQHGGRVTQHRDHVTQHRDHVTQHRDHVTQQGALVSQGELSESQMQLYLPDMPHILSNPKSSYQETNQDHRVWPGDKGAESDHSSDIGSLLDLADELGDDQPTTVSLISYMYMSCKPQHTLGSMFLAKFFCTIKDSVSPRSLQLIKIIMNRIKLHVCHFHIYTCTYTYILGIRFKRGTKTHLKESANMVAVSCSFVCRENTA